MTRNDYLVYAIKNKLLTKRAWWLTVMSRRSVEDHESEYTKVTGGLAFVRVNDDWVSVDDYKSKEPMLNIKMTLDLPANLLKSMPMKMKIPLGEFIVKYITIEIPFNGKIIAPTGKMSMKQLIELVTDSLINDKITVSDNKQYYVACKFLEDLSLLFTPSLTEKLLSPPDDMIKFKADSRISMIKKYGDDWESDPSKIVEYSDGLKKHYNEYLAGDPSDGIVATDKNKGNALSQKFVSYGSTNSFGDTTVVHESLIEGYPNDLDKLTALFNISVANSVNRGLRTQDGGVVAKGVLKAVSSIRIVKGDCGVKEGYDVMLTNKNYKNYIGRYIIVGGVHKVMDTDYVKSVIGKPITIRSPKTCIQPQPDLCSVCAGDAASEFVNAVSLIVTSISSILTLTSLKAVHNNQISSVNIDLDDILS